MSDQTDVLQGTLDLLIMRTIALEPMHGWAIAQRIQQISDELLRVQQGSLYPALHRLEHQGWITAEWGASENNRRARFYSLTRAGRKQLETEVAKWERLSAGVNLVLQTNVRSCAAGTSCKAGCDRSCSAIAAKSDLSEELQLHLEREIERLQASGLSREEARLQARAAVRRRRADQGRVPRRARDRRPGTRSCATRATGFVAWCAIGDSPRRRC